MSILENAPTYTSHKSVRALEILDVGNYAAQDGGKLRRAVVVGDVGKSEVVMLDEALFVRYVPLPGDFLVIYEGGYMSFLPRKAFLGGYKPDGQSFADIKKGLPHGKQANPDPS